MLIVVLLLVCIGCRRVGISCESVLGHLSYVCGWKDVLFPFDGVGRCCGLRRPPHSSTRSWFVFGQETFFSVM